MNWITLFNLLFPFIETKALASSSALPFDLTPITENPDYYSGPRFIKLVQEYDLNIPPYKEFLDDRITQGKSTSRRDFFFDILRTQNEEKRALILFRIISELKTDDKEKLSALKAASLGIHTITSPIVNTENWNGDRLQKKFDEIDQAIALNNPGRAVTLCYTCLEGLYKFFIEKNINSTSDLDEIIKMSREVTRYVKGLGIYSEEISNSIITISGTVNSARNKFSESHFNQEPQQALALYVRDLTSSVSKFVIMHL